MGNKKVHPSGAIREIIKSLHTYSRAKGRNVCEESRGGGISVPQEERWRQMDLQRLEHLFVYIYIYPSPKLCANSREFRFL